MVFSQSARLYRDGMHLRLEADVDRDDVLWINPPHLSIAEAALIFERDLQALCDAQIAQALAEAAKLGSHPLAVALAPLARAELARRRAANPPGPQSFPEDFPSSRP